MRIAKKPTKMKTVRAAEEVAEVAEVDVTPEATELLFETEDVAQLLAEVTESEVVVDVADDDSDTIVFSVDGDEYVVEPEGTEEILEATRRPLRGRKSVKASTRRRRVAGARRAARK